MRTYSYSHTSKPRWPASLLGLKNKSQTGQSLVEFSLMAVLLIVLLAGVMDLGRAYFTYLALKDAAAEGAYYGQAHPAWFTSSDSADPDNIDYRIRNSAPQGGLVNWSDATVITQAPDPVPGKTLTVTVSYPYTLITPFIGGQTLTLKARP